MNKSIFEYLEYREFLGDWIRSQPKKGHGIRTKLAEALGRQSVFISQVLHKDADFSLSQAQTAGEWMQLDRAELQFFLLLVQYARADTEKLRRYFQQEIAELKEKNLVLKNRLSGQIQNIPDEARARYYSAWYYAAARLLTAIPEFQTRNQIAKRLQISGELTDKVLSFLVEIGMVERSGHDFKITSNHIFLGNDSALIAQHHTNWRLRAMQSLEREEKNEVHYSTAVVISKADAEKIKRQLLDAIEENRKLAAESGSEELYCVTVDFFKP